MAKKKPATKKSAPAKPGPDMAARASLDDSNDSNDGRPSSSDQNGGRAGSDDNNGDDRAGS